VEDYKSRCYNRCTYGYTVLDLLCAESGKLGKYLVEFYDLNMSLDVHLTTKDLDGNEIEAYWANITHNLGPMADKAGIYYALWRPEEKGWKKAGDIVEVLEKGLAKLKARPKHYKKFDAENGWGLYEHFVPFVEKYLEACRKYPSAEISVSR